MAKLSIEIAGEVVSPRPSIVPINITKSFDLRKLSAINCCDALHGSDTSPSRKGNASGSAYHVYDVNANFIDHSTSLHKPECPCFSCTSTPTSNKPAADTGVMQWLERDLAANLSWETAVEDDEEDGLAEIQGGKAASRGGDETPYEKQHPKKSEGLSLLSQKLAAREQDRHKSPTALRRSLRFEIAPLRIQHNLAKSHGTGTRRNDCVPVPALRHLCPPGHPVHKGLPGSSSGESMTEGSSTEGSSYSSTRRTAQKQLHITSRVDCVAAAYKTEDPSLDIDDYVLWDEMHQVATF